MGTAMMQIGNSPVAGGMAKAAQGAEREMK
jgi:hypothetical protein